MAATLLPSAELQFCDSNGKPLAGGKVYFYIPNTTTPKNTWQDPQQTILNTNPVVLDAAGRAIIWGAGTYRQQVYDQFGSLIWDQITEDTSSGLIGNMTDDIFVAGTDFTPGTTTQLTLTVYPGSINNTWIYFDGVYQDDTQSSLNGTILTFTSPIPVGVGKVTVKIGNTLTIGSPSNGTVTDASVAINAAIQSTKLSYNEGGAGSIARTIQSKLQDVISLMDFGAVGNSNGTTGNGNDDTLALNAAISVCNILGKPLYVPTPPSMYRLTSTITITGNFAMYGDGVQPYVSTTNITTSNVQIGFGSWFYIDHTNKGFSAVGTTQPFSVTYKGIGTIRNQPTPNGGASFTPYSNDWDFYNSNADLYMDDVFCLNPTKFSYTTGGGRAVYHRVRGQPLTYGIWTDAAYDVCHYDYVHFWPWWSQAQGVYAWTLINSAAFITARNDSPMYTNIFAYGYNRSLWFTSNINGNTTRLTGSNWQFDYTYHGVFVDSTVVGASGQIANLITTGYGGTAQGSTNVGLYFDPASQTSELWIKGFFPSLYGAYGASVAGTSNIVHISMARAQQWNVGNGNYPAYNTGPTCQIIFSEQPEAVSPFAGTPPIFGGSGIIISPMTKGFFSGTTNTGGQIVINHGAIAQPNEVFITLSGGGNLTYNYAVTATQITVTFMTASTGAVLNAGAVSFSWETKF